MVGSVKSGQRPDLARNRTDAERTAALPTSILVVDDPSTNDLLTPTPPHHHAFTQGGAGGSDAGAMIGRAEDGTLAAIAVAEEDERELEVSVAGP